MSIETKINNNYRYNVIVTDVYDGDTITCDIYLGLDITLTNQKIRLYGINAPEVRGDNKEKGYQVRDYLKELILNKKIELYTLEDKRGKFGRLLGIIIYDNKNINQNLLDSGLCKEYIL